MSMMFRFKFLVFFAGSFFCVAPLQPIFADGTNLMSPRQAQEARDSLNALLQIQDQLHTMQLLIESNRTATAVQAQHDATDLSTRMQMLEQSVAAQRASELEATQKAQRLTLIVAGAFGVLGLTAMLLMAYFQWRAVTRLVELSAFLPSTAGLGTPKPSPLLSSTEVHVAPEPTAIQASNGRLFSVVERLEKRLLELENTARPPLADIVPASNGNHNGAPALVNDRQECIANLVAEGQVLLNQGEAEKALECFDQALALEPGHAETLVKKAGALETLDRLNEALDCYDRAIEADSSMTIAYLHKGGLFNRMSRYEEALQCYEHALHTHDRKASEKVAV